jgi:hypothetical protein
MQELNYDCAKKSFFYTAYHIIHTVYLEYDKLKDNTE